MSLKCKKVLIFFDASAYTFRWLRALEWAKQELMKKNFRITFVGNKKYDPGIVRSCLKNTSWDAILIAHSELSVARESAQAAFLQELRNYTARLVWLDIRDGSGRCSWNILPYVDRYLKKQLLRETEQYYRIQYGGAAWHEFYHDRYHLSDKSVEEYAVYPLDKAYENKIGLSWNVGIGDHYSRQYRYKAELTSMYRIPAVFRQFTEPDYTRPSANRHFDTHFSGSRYAWSSVIGYQRTKCEELLASRGDITYIAKSKHKGRTSYKEYYAELKNAKTALSPFGFGEICGRDFEAFIYGCTLLKPSMEHLRTWPEWYIPDGTYVPFSWDFSDFNEVLDGILFKQDEYLRIAGNGQDMYRKFMSEEGKRLFAEHLSEELQLW